MRSDKANILELRVSTPYEFPLEIKVSAFFEKQSEAENSLINKYNLVFSFQICLQ